MKPAVLALVTLLTVPSVAAADPVRIVTAGFQGVTWGEESDLRLIGSGFDLGNFAATRDMPLFRCHPCTPGTTLDLSSNFTGDWFGEGFATFDSTSFGYIYYSGEMQFAAGTIVVPDIPAPPPHGQSQQAVFSLPFAFSADLSAFATDARTGEPLFEGVFSGRGVAMLTLINNPGFVGIYADRIQYDFQAADPVPEPATLILLGSGLTGILARSRRFVHRGSRHA